MLKQRVSRLLRRKPHRRASAVQRSFQFASPADSRLPRFWQKRFCDFNVWSRKKKVEKLQYMHMNPVKRGLVENPRNWPWSNCAFRQRRGEVLIEVDAVE